MNDEGQDKGGSERSLNHENIVSFLDRLSAGNGKNVLTKIQESSEDVETILRDLANGPTFESLFKLVRTQTHSMDWVAKADFAYVGLPPECEALGFRSGFETQIRPRLGMRSDGFEVIFKALDACERPTIIETGCLRVPQNWDGDGQSTFQFDWYARERHGSVITIDINSESIDSARRACSSVTSTVLNDSVATLNALGAQARKPVSLIYLDSFDLDLSDPMPSAIHHSMEVMAARRLIGPGTILCIDDFNVPPLGPGGKGLIVDRFMESVNAEVLYVGYQKIWRVQS
ncbi:hypothetical protein CD178_02548 [Komagataeibacter saccharivorans]|uniref:Uncharacterized protein n=1 Tax=Komagataeibacter saccharivorans TaxID=265959 RepID=A0A347WEK2_9PROT|nr:hypothetical protein [Komagataeibacter saccharivorans]AXY23295.1 hypothetical protein CD178_02548 [Komagataeibacter saccharivorans]